MADYDDDWETDPEPANPISERDQRWGAKTLPKDSIGHQQMSMEEIRNRVLQQDNQAREADYLKNKTRYGEKVNK